MARDSDDKSLADSKTREDQKDLRECKLEPVASVEQGHLTGPIKPLFPEW